MDYINNIFNLFNNEKKPLTTYSNDEIDNTCNFVNVLNNTTHRGYYEDNFSDYTFSTNKDFKISISSDSDKIIKKTV